MWISTLLSLRGCRSSAIRSRDCELFDAHTHLGQNDPDGMRQSPEELLRGLRGCDARGCFVFPMHEPDGYPPANDFVIDVAG